VPPGLAYVFLVFLQGAAVYQDVVEVGSAEVVQEGSEYVVDKSLEVGGRIREAEGHDQRLEESVTGPEGSLLFLPSGHPDEVMVVPPTYVNNSDFGSDTQGTSRRPVRRSVGDTASNLL